MLRQAVRSLRRSPAYTITAVLTLGLGISLTTSALTLLNGFVLRPLPFVDPDGLVDVAETSATELCSGCGVGTSYPIYEEWRRASRSFAGMEAVSERPFNLSAGDRAAIRVGGAVVSAGVFRLLGATPIVGRDFTDADDRSGAPPVAIVSYGIWQESLGGAAIAGRTVRLNGIEHDVIGVMPRDFGFPEFARVWTPVAPHAREWALDDRSLGVIARLSAGVTLAQARDEMAAIGHGIAERFSSTHRAWTTKVTPLRQSFIGGEALLVWLLTGMVLIVLLIACVNLAGVGLARAAARERELAVRAAIGADRRALLRLLMTESVLLAVGGGAAALVLAPWLIDFARSQLPQQIPAWLRFDIDWRVASAFAVVTLSAGFASGVLPALRASRPDVLGSLKAGAGVGGDAQHLRLWLVGLQLALALILLVSGGLLTRTFVRAIAAEPGYDTSALLTGDIGLHHQRYRDSAGVLGFVAGFEDAAARMPGVSSSAVSRWMFLAGFGQSDRPIEIEGHDVAAGASPRFAFAVTPGYFQTLGLAILDGRGFADRDDARGEAVAIVNDAFARRGWGAAPPLGKRVRLPGEGWRTIVGVVRSVGASGLAARRDPPSYIYVPFAQSPGRPITAHLRAAGSPYSVAPGLVNAVQRLDRDEPVENVRSAADTLATESLPARVAAVLVDALAILAVLLAAIGLYGVVAYTVGRRVREFGIRMAVGATRGDVLRLVLMQAARVTLAGSMLGIATAAASTGLLRSVLWGTDPLDSAVFAFSAALLVAVMFTATIVPARRAARIDPQTALRDE